MLAQSDYAADTIVRIDFFFFWTVRSLQNFEKSFRNLFVYIVTQKLYLILIEYLNIVLVLNLSIVCLRQYYNRYYLGFPWNRNKYQLLHKLALNKTITNLH